MSGIPLVFDGHNDTVLDVYLEERGGGRSFFESGGDGHLDLPRAHGSRYGGGFFAVFVPNRRGSELQETPDGYRVPLSDPVDHERAKDFTYEVLEYLFRMERLSGGRFRVPGSFEELRGCFESGAVVGVPHLEGAEAVAPDLSNLDVLYDLGVRSVGLTWSRPNEFGTGVPFAFPRRPDTGPGLTDAGFELVHACNDRGILIDLAHINEEGFWDVDDASDAPLVVSHANAYELCRSTRNLTDEQLDCVGDSNGVVGVSFAAENLHPDGEQDASIPLSIVADQVSYIVDRVGVDHVGIGSDFDGAVVPDAVGDVTGIPALFAELKRHGFTPTDLEKIAHRNWFRVLERTWTG